MQKKRRKKFDGVIMIRYRWIRFFSLNIICCPIEVFIKIDLQDECQQKCEHNRSIRDEMNEPMGAIGPWATGKCDYNPSSGLVGVKPIVDHYSVTRFSSVKLLSVAGLENNAIDFLSIRYWWMAPKKYWHFRWKPPSHSSKYEVRFLNFLKKKIIQFCCKIQQIYLYTKWQPLWSIQFQKKQFFELFFSENKIDL